MLEHQLTSRRSVVLDDPPDQEVISRVRAGDTSAYDVIYRRHHDAVHRLARRYAKHASEADDVTSEVFAKTLRAIVHGHGPTDDAGPYLLRSVRNTLTSLRVGGDARLIPTDDDHLDRPGAQSSSRCDDDDVSLAFLDLPDRYRNVLWATVVEGRGPADIADGSIDAGAVASLTHRARFALRRSYLISSTRRRCAVDTCREIRQLMPGVVLGQAAAPTCGRIDDHALSCAECAEVRDDMERLAQQMPARSLLGLLGAWWARLGSSAAQLAGSAAPIVAPAIAATVGIAATMVAASSHEVDRPAIATGPAIELTEPLGVEADVPDVSVEALDSDDLPLPNAAPVVEPATTPRAVADESGRIGPPETASPTGAKSTRRSIPGPANTGMGGVDPADISSTGGVGVPDPSVGPADGPALDDPTDTLLINDPVDPLAGLPSDVSRTVDGVIDEVVGDVSGGVDTVIDEVVQPVLAGAGQIVGTTTGAVVEVVDRTVDGVSGTAGTTVAAVDEVVGAVGSTLAEVTAPIGPRTGSQPVPPPTVPLEPLVDVVTVTGTVTGSADDTLDAVIGPLTGLLGR